LFTGKALSLDRGYGRIRRYCGPIFLFFAGGHLRGFSINDIVIAHPSETIGGDIVRRDIAHN